MPNRYKVGDVLGIIGDDWVFLICIVGTDINQYGLQYNWEYIASTDDDCIGKGSHMNMHQIMGVRYDYMGNVYEV